MEKLYIVERLNEEIRKEMRGKENVKNKEERRKKRDNRS